LTNSFLILDKQGPFSNVIKRSLKETNVEAHRCKNINKIIDILEVRPKKDFKFLLFIFFEEYELINCVKLYDLKIPIVFAPTNKKSYEKLSEIEDIVLMNLSVNKREYVQQIMSFMAMNFVKF